MSPGGFGSNQCLKFTVFFFSRNLKEFINSKQCRQKEQNSWIQLYITLKKFFCKSMLQTENWYSAKLNAKVKQFNGKIKWMDYFRKMLLFLMLLLKYLITFSHCYKLTLEKSKDSVVVVHGTIFKQGKEKLNHLQFSH